MRQRKHLAVKPYTNIQAAGAAGWHTRSDRGGPSSDRRPPRLLPHPGPSHWLFPERVAPPRRHALPCCPRPSHVLARRCQSNYCCCLTKGPMRGRQRRRPQHLACWVQSECNAKSCLAQHPEFKCAQGRAFVCGWGGGCARGGGGRPRPGPPEKNPGCHKNRAGMRQPQAPARPGLGARPAAMLPTGIQNARYAHAPCRMIQESYS
jgi:hypothetical protein